MTTKKFRLISALMAALMVLGSLTVVPAFADNSAAPANLNDNVITWFDFEGDDEATRLLDKATKGTANVLDVQGNVTIADGVASIPATTGSDYISITPAATDAGSLVGKTLFAKVKITGAAAAAKTFMRAAMGASYAMRWMANGKDIATNGGYAITAWTQDSGNHTTDATLRIRHAVTSTYPAQDTYVYYVQSLEVVTEGGEEKLVSKLYMSLDGTNYAMDELKQGKFDMIDITAFRLGDNSKSDGQAYTFDDFRVYDKVLTADEWAERRSRFY